MDKQHYLDISLKARYYTKGVLNEKTKYIAFVFHGYGQLASSFINRFDKLDSNHFIVVPEGLNRFYINGMAGKVGATWMTKEDRQIDIENQSVYLNALLLRFGDLEKQNIKLWVLGFSQGVSTAIRWIVKNQIEVDTLFNWGGSLPTDLAEDEVKNALRSLNMITILGDDDPYFNEKAREQIDAWINRYAQRSETISYSGDHRVIPEVLNKIILEKLH